MNKKYSKKEKLLKKNTIFATLKRKLNYKDKKII